MLPIRDPIILIIPVLRDFVLLLLCYIQLLTPPPTPPLQGRGVPTEFQAAVKAAAAPLPCTTLYTHFQRSALKGRQNTGRGETPAHWGKIKTPKG